MRRQDIMGRKMSQARYNGQELKIYEYDSNIIYPNLTCFYCSAKVHHVQVHKRNLGDRVVTINAYFRLNPNQQHMDMCKYTIDGALSNIYAKCADNELMSKENNYYQVRLLLPFDNTDNKEANLNKSPDTGNKSSRTNLNYISNGKKTAYLSTMEKILKLRTEVESNSDLGRKLKLKFYSSSKKNLDIPWEKFYFDATSKRDYIHLWNYLQTQPQHPVCIDGFVKSFSKIKSGKYALTLEAVKLSKNPEQKDRRVSVSYYFPREEIVSNLEIKVGSRVVVYSKCTSKPIEEWSPKNDTSLLPKKIFYHSIFGDINDKKQIYFPE